VTIAISVEQYLSTHCILYDLVPHASTISSLDTAKVAQISAEVLAKSVVLRTNKRSYFVAVLPASHVVQIQALSDCVHADVTLANEEEIAWLFPDCALGAVPPIGGAYGIETVVDDSIDEQSDVYFEGGDHVTLVHMTGTAFRTVMAPAQHGRFSRPH
jgi:Ala-tRNA(Pro) deacylase